MIKERKPGAQSVMTLRRYIINNWNVSNRSPDLLSPTWSKREGRVSWKTQYVTLSSDLHSWLYTTEKRALVGVRDNISHTISELSAKGLDVSKEKFSLSDFYLIAQRKWLGAKTVKLLPEHLHHFLQAHSMQFLKAVSFIFSRKAAYK